MTLPRDRYIIGGLILIAIVLAVVVSVFNLDPRTCDDVRDDLSRLYTKTTDGHLLENDMDDAADLAREGREMGCAL